MAGQLRATLRTVGQAQEQAEKRQETFHNHAYDVGQALALFAMLLELGFSAIIQTAFIERLNLTIRQGVAPLSRRTWSLAKSNEYLLLHVHWWRTYYHLSRAHESRQVRAPGLRRRYRQRTPAMAAGLIHRIWSVGDILRLPILPEGGAC